MIRAIALCVWIGSSSINLVAASCPNDAVVSAVNITEDSEIKALYVYETPNDDRSKKLVVGQDVALTLKHGSRAYLGDMCKDSFAPDVFHQFKLLDKELSFTVDLGSIGCGCNGALYMVSMPAVDSDGNVAPTPDRDYYCGANAGKHDGGQFCPEMDLLEANNEAMHITPHKCDVPTAAGHYVSCDEPGYSVTTDGLAYGPGASAIDTLSPFNMTMRFVTDGAEAPLLQRIETILSQWPDRQLQLVLDNSSYLSEFTAPLAAGMTLVYSHWGFGGETMKWLDVPPCDISVGCDGAGAFTVSDIRVADLNWVVVL